MREHGITPVFLLADGQVSWSLLPISVSGGTVEPETPIHVSSRLQVRSEKAKKG